MVKSVAHHSPCIILQSTVEFLISFPWGDIIKLFIGLMLGFGIGRLYIAIKTTRAKYVARRNAVLRHQFIPSYGGGNKENDDDADRCAFIIEGDTWTSFDPIRCRQPRNAHPLPPIRRAEVDPKDLYAEGISTGMALGKALATHTRVPDNRARILRNPDDPTSPVNDLLISTLDGCEMCGGRRGGIPGCLNVINGKRICDYCHAILMEGGK